MKILVNEAQWNATSEDQKKAILQGLISTGSLKEGDEIVPDADVEAFDPEKTIKIQWDPIGDICRIACDTAAGAAFAWCTANTAGAGLALCMAAAEAARQECRKHC